MAKKTRKNQEEIRIYLTNLGAYNRGALVGKWFDLPVDDVGEMEQEVLNMKGSLPGDEELFITDFEAPFGIEEYESLVDLNDFVEWFSALDEYDQDKVAYLMDEAGYDRDGAMSNYEDTDYYPDMNMEELAEEFVDQGLFGEISDSIKYHIDYKSIARELSMDYHETDKGIFRAP